MNQTGAGSLNFNIEDDFDDAESLAARTVFQGGKKKKKGKGKGKKKKGDVAPPRQDSMDSFEKFYAGL